MGTRHRQRAKAAGTAAGTENMTSAKSSKAVSREGHAEATKHTGRLLARVSAAAAGRHSLEPEDALEAIHWLRQALGLIMGIVFGIAGITGGVGISTFLVTCVVVPDTLFRNTLHVEEDQIAKLGSLKTEGLMPAVAIFILFWILFYTSFLR